MLNFILLQAGTSQNGNGWTSIVMIVVSKFTETPPQETIDRHFTV